MASLDVASGDKEHSGDDIISEDNHVMDKASVIRLLRVFVGAVGICDDEFSGPLEADPSMGQDPTTSSPSTGKRARISPDNGTCTERVGNGGGGAAAALMATADSGSGSSMAAAAKAVQSSHLTGPGEERGESSMESTGCGQDSVHGRQREQERQQSIDHEDGPEGDEASGARAHAAARIEAGCTLWDLSMGEPDAEAMFSDGLIAVAIAVLQHCADAESSQQEVGQGGSVASSAGEGAGTEAGGGSPEGGLSLMEAIRLREITCGLLANVCTHRRLREETIRSGMLAQEIMRAFHASDDPPCLTEILRIFASVASSLGKGEPRRLDEALVERQTLERVVYFLENSLDEKLLGRACWFLYLAMYRCGDAVVVPLVQDLGVEGVLASLLIDHRNDLTFEKVAGAETALDAILRCLEVLSTSDVSPIGPSMRLATAQPHESRPASTAVRTGEGSASIASAGSSAHSSGGCAAAGSHLAPAPVAGGTTAPVAGLDGGPGPSTNGDGDDASPGASSSSIIPPQHGPRAAGETAGSTAGSPDAREPGGLQECAHCPRGDANRARVVHGLVGVLRPWEHSRRSQQTALLVLGNILEAAEEGGDGRLLLECSSSLEEGLSRVAAEAAEAADEDEAPDFARRVARARKDFLDSVRDVSGEDSSIGEEMGAQLRESSAVVRRAIDLIHCI